MSALEIRIGDIRDRQTVLPAGYRFTADDRERYEAEIPRWVACGVLHEVDDRPAEVERPQPRTVDDGDPAVSDPPAAPEAVRRGRRRVGG